MNPSIYVSSRVRHAEMWKTYRQKGRNIISTWIDEPSPEEIEFPRLWTSILQEIEGSDELLLYAESWDFPLKGALVEVGMALACKKKVKVVIPDVGLDGATFRPLGSWIKHPLVEVFTDIRLECKPFAIYGNQDD